MKFNKEIQQRNSTKKFNKEIQQNFNTISNIIILLILIFGAVGYSVGFHFPNEILPGQFANGNYSFNGSVGIGTSSPNASLEVIGTVNFPNRSAVRVFSDTSQTVATSIWTTITFEKVDIDTQNEFDLVTETFTAKSDGIYSILGQIHYGGPPSSTVMRIGIYKNGASYQTRNFNAAFNGWNEMISISDIIKLNAGDTLTLRTYHNAGAQGNIGPSGTFLDIYKIN